VTMIPASPTSEPKADDPEAGTQRPATGILARLHGHETSSGVDPFTLEERQRREEAQVPLSGSKAAMMQRSDPHVSLLSSGEASGSRVGAPSSVNPPSSGPSSQVGSPQQNRSQPSVLHSPTPSQSASNIIPASETAVESHLGGSNRRDSAEAARKPPLSGTIAEEAPPAYGSAP